MKKQLLFLITGLAFCGQVWATDLYTVYQQALQSDPTLQQAQATSNANKEGVPQAWSGLLPSLSGLAGTSSTHTSQQFPNQTTGVIPDTSSNAHSYQLSLTQPIFNFQSMMQVRAAKATAKQADATYNAALQDLIIRVATAYFNVLQAQDNLNYIQAEKKASEDQLKQVKAQFHVGISTMTDVYQAQANYDSLVAQVISAQNGVINSFESLRQITGITYPSVAPLKGKELPLIHPDPANSQDWIKSAENNNWTLLSSRFAEQSAKENIRVNYAGHFPTVNATGEYTNGNSSGVGLTNAATNSSTTVWKSNVGLQLNVPLFQGGLVASKTRQAQDQYLAASDQMEITHRQVVLQAEEGFNNVVSGISKVEADRIAVTSAKSALESTNAGYKAGTKTLLDVLTAQQNLYQAQANLSADQYAYIINTLSLKQAAGSLSAQDIIAINHWLVHE